jgi:hypothetical protein
MHHFLIPLILLGWMVIFKPKGILDHLKINSCKRIKYFVGQPLRVALTKAKALRYV